MATKLKELVNLIEPGTPLTTNDLAAMGISADLAVHYVKAGWLTRLARGVYCRPNAPLDQNAALLLLQRRIPGLHVGGKSALEWYGIRHYVKQTPILNLYGWSAAQLPPWFTSRFSATYHRKRIFTETVDNLLYVGNFENRMNGPAISAPERALLEMLSEIGVRQPLTEAEEILEGTYTFRAGILRTLLENCTSVKTVRLCIQLGNSKSLPWAKKLNPADLPTGSKTDWISRSANGLMVLKP